MKVGKLKELLEDVPDDYDVVIASDSEGNDYAYMENHNVAMAVEEDGVVQWVLSEEDVDPDSDVEFHENAIVLWPS